MDDRIEAFARRVEEAVGQVDPGQQKLLRELMIEITQLTEENIRLRRSLIKSAQKTNGMSSKLKDALYE